MEYKLTVNSETALVDVDAIDDHSLRCSMNREEFEVSYSLLSDNHIHLEVNGRSFNAYVRDGTDGTLVVIDGIPYLVADADAQRRRSGKKRKGADTPTEVTPVTPSVVVSILVKEGETVKKGQGVVVLSAMKMEVTLSAPYHGSVTAVNVKENDTVSPGDILIEIDREKEELEE